jgi:hypothetical protein
MERSEVNIRSRELQIAQELGGVSICWPTESSAKSWDNLEPSAGGEGLSRSANSARRRHDGVMGQNDILPGSIILGEIEDGRGIERLAYHQVGSSSTY